MIKHFNQYIIIIPILVIISSNTSCFYTKSPEELIKDKGGVCITLGIIDKNSDKNLHKALEHTVSILESRILNLGLKHYIISSDKTSKTITIKLPKSENLERLRNIIQEQGNLGFWETFSNEEIFEYLSYANQYLYRNNINLEPAPQKKDSSANKLDDPAIELIDKLELADKLKAESKQQKKDNPLFYVLSPNMDRYKQLKFKTANVGISKVKDTAIVNKYLALDSIKQNLPGNLRLLWEIKPFDQKDEFIYLVAIKISAPNGKPALGSSVIKEAKVDFNKYNGTPEILLEMNEEGSKQWANITRNNIGKEIAIVLDNKVYSHPQVASEISGGKSSISGAFTYEEAKDFASILNSGSIPFQLKIIKEELIAPE